MRHGDISNELPRRVLVVSDIFLETKLVVKKKFKFIKVPELTQDLRRDILSRLYLYTVNREVTLELISYVFDTETLDAFVEKIDKAGTNPFRYYTSYESINHLMSELPYRPEVVGVIDKPDKLLRYGHWGLDFNQL
jgi:hypothetical protein